MAYIHSSIAISAQRTFGKKFPYQPVVKPQRRMPAIEPEYKQYISPVKLRRMSRVVKMGVTSALQCLKEANIDNPEAIITATGWGCLSDTFKFLDEIGEKQEEMLSPATFIQSTHNTVGGQIALMLGCQEYNSVYVNDSSSFEHGLLDAMLLLAEGKENILLGGVDEITDIDFTLKDQAGWWKKKLDTMHLAESKIKGTIAGEGAVFFLLSNRSNDNAASCIKGLKMSLEQDPNDVLAELLSENHLAEKEIDVVLSGINGDNRVNSIYLDILNSGIGNALPCYYKHHTGDFDSASAFSLWLANQIILTQKIPDDIKINKGSESVDRINHILIHHFKKPSEHAFILVSKTGL